MNNTINRREDRLQKSVRLLLFVVFLFCLFCVGAVVLSPKENPGTEYEDKKEVVYDGYATLSYVLDDNFHGPSWAQYGEYSSSIEELYQKGNSIVAVVIEKKDDDFIRSVISNQGATCTHQSTIISDNGLTNVRRVSASSFSDYCRGQLPPTLPGYVVRLVGRGDDGKYLLSIEQGVPITYLIIE